MATFGKVCRCRISNDNFPTPYSHGSACPSFGFALDNFCNAYTRDMRPYASITRDTNYGISYAKITAIYNPYKANILNVTLINIYFKNNNDSDDDADSDSEDITRYNKDIRERELVQKLSTFIWKELEHAFDRQQGFVGESINEFIRGGEFDPYVNMDTYVYGEKKIETPVILNAHQIVNHRIRSPYLEEEFNTLDGQDFPELCYINRLGCYKTYLETSFVYNLLHGKEDYSKFVRAIEVKNGAYIPITLDKTKTEVLQSILSENIIPPYSLIYGVNVGLNHSDTYLTNLPLYPFRTGWTIYSYIYYKEGGEKEDYEYKKSSYVVKIKWEQNAWDSITNNELPYFTPKWKISNPDDLIKMCTSEANYDNKEYIEWKRLINEMQYNFYIE